MESIANRSFLCKRIRRSGRTASRGDCYWSLAREFGRHHRNGRGDLDWIINDRSNRRRSTDRWCHWWLARSRWSLKWYWIHCHLRGQFWSHRYQLSICLWRKEQFQWVLYLDILIWWNVWRNRSKWGSKSRRIISTRIGGRA